MIGRYFYLVLALLFIFCAGCESLPPGEAPLGPIVKTSDDSNAVLDETSAVEEMVTAIASSELLITSNTQPNVFLGKTNVQSEYSAAATTLSSRVYRELIGTGIIDCTTNKSSDFVLTSTFVKLQTKDNGDIIFKWSMGLIQAGSSSQIFNYSLKVSIKPLESSVRQIKPEEITPVYK